MTTILQASARPDGDTYHVASQLADRLSAQRVDLLDYNIAPFRYDQTYAPADQFIEVVRQFVLPADHLVFATPVYWYTMSGGMKIFLDRFSDLLKSQKALGRQLRGKAMSVCSVGNVAAAPAHFYEPFRLSAEYLGMEYRDEWHGWLDNNNLSLRRRNSV